MGDSPGLRGNESAMPPIVDACIVSSEDVHTPLGVSHEGKCSTHGPILPTAVPSLSKNGAQSRADEELTLEHENGSDAGENDSGWVDYSAQNEEVPEGADHRDMEEQKHGGHAEAVWTDEQEKFVDLGVDSPSVTPPLLKLGKLNKDSAKPLVSVELAGDESSGPGCIGEQVRPLSAELDVRIASTRNASGGRVDPEIAVDSRNEEAGERSARSSPPDLHYCNPTDVGRPEEEQMIGDLVANRSGEEDTKESGKAESDVTGLGDGEMQESGVNDDVHKADKLEEPVEGLQKLAKTATEEEGALEGVAQNSHPSNFDILHCGGTEKWEALLANIACGEIQLNPVTGSFEHRKEKKAEEQEEAVQGNGRGMELEPERRRGRERSPEGKKRKVEQGRDGAGDPGTLNSRKLARNVNEFVRKLKELIEQDLSAEMQRRASRCTPSTLGAKVSRLAGHPNAGRGPASGYMDESAKNSAALREAAEPIIKALLFRGHYGTTTLAATMAGPLFYPANAAGPELLTALREACEGGPGGAGRAGPMRRLVLELQEGIRDALPRDADPHEEQASMQAWGAAIRACVGAQLDLLEAVDFFKLCCAEAAATAQEEAAGVMLTAKRSKRAILSSRQAAGSKSKWEHLEDSVGPLSQIVAHKYVAAAMHGGEGFSGLHARLQVLTGDLLRASADLEPWRGAAAEAPRRPSQGAGDPTRLIHAIAAVQSAAGAPASLAVAEAALPAVVREYVLVDPAKWGLLWQQQGVACNGPQVPEPVALPLGGAPPEGGARKRRRVGEGEEEDEYVGRWGRRVWRMKGAKKEWFNGQVIKGPRHREEVKPADKCYVMRYKPQDDPQGRSTLEKLTEAQVIRAIENYEKAVAEGECAKEESDSEEEDERGAGRPRQQDARGKKRPAEEAGPGTSEEREGSKRKKGPTISVAEARGLLRHLQAFFGASPPAFAAAHALYTGAERLFPGWERGVDGEGRHVYRWSGGGKLWLCYTRMQVRETQEEEGAHALPPRIQLSTTPRPLPPPPKATLPTPRPAPVPKPVLPPPKPSSRNSSPRPPSPSPPPAPRPPSAATKRPRPPSSSPVGAPVLFSFEGPPPGCRLTPSQESEVMEVVRRQGWEIRQEVRKHGISAGQVDKYYMPPNGDKRLTSLRKVWEYLHHGKGASARTARDRGGATPSTDQAGFDRARGGVAALLAAQAAAQREPPEEPREEAKDEEWDELGVWQGFGVAAAERVKRRRRKAGGTPGSYALEGSLEGGVLAAGPPSPSHTLLKSLSPRLHAGKPADDANGRGRTRTLTDLLKT